MKNLSAALVKALGEIGGAAKDKENPFFKSKYADLGSVIDAVKPALAKNDLGFTQHCQPSEDGVIVETILHHASGETLSMGSLYVPANKRDAQGFGSAQTYARRYSLQTAFGVPAEDDDDNAAVQSGQRADAAPDGKVSDDQFRQLQAAVDRTGADLARFCSYFQVQSLKEVPAARFDDALAALEAKAKKTSALKQQLEQSVAMAR